MVESLKLLLGEQRINGNLKASKEAAAYWYGCMVMANLLGNDDLVRDIAREIDANPSNIVGA